MINEAFEPEIGAFKRLGMHVVVNAVWHHHHHHEHNHHPLPFWLKIRGATQ